ncbi:MAG: uracil-DNA glycosylase family protein [Methylophilaceae bacterium]
MSLTREDMLRELELLPTWQLRKPTVKLKPEPMQIVEMVDAQAKPQNLRIIVSDDTNYLFLLEALSSNEEEVLLQNMLKAMHTKPLVDIGSQGMLDLSAYTQKVIIVMGELAATTLLNLALQIEDLRGKLHQHNNLPVVVTYHPSHLLKNIADKANAWADLCLAKSVL